MTVEPAQVVAAWPLGATLAAAVAARGLTVGRRREALNEALHELRRPLQALALAAPADRPGGGMETAWSLQLAATALERLEREINGEPAVAARAPLFVRPLLQACVGPWQRRAELAGGSLELRWMAGEAMVEGERCALAQALDNLIANAIEHGGPEIVVEARLCRGRLRLCVADSGVGPASTVRRRPPGLRARLSGRRRHGHGLRLVRRTAAEHGGGFRLDRSERGARAVLELPLLDEVEAAG
jgi:signal transduction histidine kinase